MFKVLSVKDQLAGVTADMDQVQTEINNARRRFPTDQHWQLEMDRAQSQLDAKVKRVAFMRDIADIIDA